MEERRNIILNLKDCGKRLMPYAHRAEETKEKKGTDVIQLNEKNEDALNLCQAIEKIFLYG